jgi:peptidoglycan hydrolase CwlO-like protein
VLRPVFDFGKQALSLMKDMQQNKADIKELQQELKEVRQELRDLTAVVQQLAFQMQRNQDNERHEREKMLLRMEIALLRTQHGLPPPSTSDDSPESDQS